VRCAVCGAYGDAINVCNDVLDSRPTFDYDDMFSCSLNCDGGLAALFDDDIQALIGLTVLYETLHQRARATGNEVEVKMYSCSLEIPIKSFAHYLKIRSLHKLYNKSHMQSSWLALTDAISCFAQCI